MGSASKLECRTELSDSQKRLLEPIIKCTEDVFSIMLGWDVQVVGVISNDRHAMRHDVSGILGLSGTIRGSIVLSVDQDVALEAAGAFLGEKPTNLNADVIDTVGELTNMIGGSSKDRLNIAGLCLGLPTVVSGPNHSISFEPGANVEMLQFQSPFGPLTVEIALVGWAAVIDA